MLLLLPLFGFVIALVTVTLGGGGGGLYTGLLIAVFGVSPAVAVSTSLTTLVPTVLIGSYNHWRAGNIRIDRGKYIFASGAIGACLGALAVPVLPSASYQKVLGVIILAMLLMLRWKPKRNSRAAPAPVVNVTLLGLLAGALSGFAGVSGSAPIVIGLLLIGCSAIETIGTSVFALVGISIVGFLAHVTEGNVDWKLVALLGAGTTAGGFLSSIVVSRADPAMLERLLRPAVVATSATSAVVLIAT